MADIAPGPLPPWVIPADWRPVGAPPVLGKAPTTAKQIVLAPLDVVTRFSAPILSGEKGGVVIGSAVLQLPLMVDSTMGDFTLPIQFQPGSIVLWMVKMTYRAFNGTDTGSPRQTAVSLGSSPGGGEIIPQNGFDVLHTLTTQTAAQTLPFAIDPNPFMGYITVKQFGATQGQGVVLIGYARI